MAEIYYSEVVRIHQWLIGRKTQVESEGVHAQASLCSLLPMRGHTEHTSPVKMHRHVCGIFALGGPLEIQQPTFIGACHVGTLCLTCTKCPEGKQVFSINHIVHTNSLGTVSHP